MSLPRGVRLASSPPALIIYCNSLWWNRFYLKGARAVCIGHIAIIGPRALEGDEKHELVHVEQYIREPLIHPFLYIIQNLLRGYEKNKYEVEAYRRAGNPYIKRMR